MSALAAMFTPPAVRHTPTRIVVSGKTVTRISDIPPLPDASDRQEVKAKVRRASDALYREKNRDYFAEYQKKWAQENPDKKREAANRYYAKKKDDPEFKEKVRKNTERYRTKNPDAYKLKQQKWYEANKAYFAAYRAAHRDRMNELGRQYYERKKHERAQQANIENALPQAHPQKVNDRSPAHV